MMHREVARDGDQLERFRREARAVAKVSPPHVVGVIDAGEEDHTPFIVLEYVDGETLKERIRRLRRLDVAEAVAYAIEIARGLQAAHDRGIVHRDVKPQNVLLDEDGAARVTDFGIARSLADEGLTADGRVLGTTDYVSPEQALGHAVTPQSDVYSLGVVLYEMLTGDVPFHGENQVAVAMRHVREELPDVQAKRPEVSSALAAVVDRVDREGPRRPLRLRRRLHRRPRGRAGDRDRAQRPHHRRGDDRLPVAARAEAPPRPGRRAAPGALAARHRAVAVAVVAAFALLADRAERGTGHEGREAAAHAAGRSRSARAARRTTTPPATSRSTRRPRRSCSTATRRRSGTPRRTSTATSRRPASASRSTPSPASRRASSSCAPARPAGAARSSPPTPPTLPTSIDDPAWTRVGRIPKATRVTRADVDTGGKRQRWYLIWITKFAPGQERVAISEVVPLPLEACTCGTPRGVPPRPARAGRSSAG